MARTAAFLAALVWLGSGNLPAWLQDADFRITTDVNLVLLDASVKVAKGGYVSDLNQGNFRVEEDGIQQKITSFANRDVPVAAGLILDASGSMRTKRDSVNLAGLAFIDASNPKDQIFVTDFNDKVLPALPDGVPFTDSREILRRALSRHPAEGKTVLYDAIEAGLEHLKSADRDKRTLIVVTDGGDNASRHTLAQLMHDIEASQTTIYTVGIYDEDDPDRNPGVLRSIAQVSGGECFILADYKEIIATGQKIAQDIRRRYTIGYVPDRRNAKAGLHRIRVTATAPDRGRLIVRTRTNYLDPLAKDPAQGK